MQNPENKASLGCGTLILISLIVMIFGNANRGYDKQLKNDFRQLQSEVSFLKSEIENQSRTLDEINKALKELNRRSSQPRPRVTAPSTTEAPFSEN